MPLHADLLHSLYERFIACGMLFTTDSRRIVPGGMFFALRGESFDGNRFAAEALEAGADSVVVDNAGVAATLDPGRVFLVPHVLEALQRLAAHHRAVLGIPILAITGSNGKTTTKELVARVLAHRFAVAVTEGNLNNHIGVPLTLLSMGPGVEFGVVEMGASAQGEIALLCRIAQPDFGIITNVGLSHLEGFGGPEGVRQGKGELFDWLAAHGGLAFVREGDEVLMAMAAERPELRAVLYDDTAGAIPSHLEGAYNRFNIAAAVAIGRHFEIADEQIRAAVASFVPDNNRSQVVTTARNRLVVDCYNANPSSMRAAIANFAVSEAEDYPHKVAILGDMLELGEWSAAEHKAVLELALGAGFEQILLVGKEFAQAAGMTSAVRTFHDAATLAAWLGENPPAGKSILLKGSRGIRLESLLASL